MSSEKIESTDRPLTAEQIKDFDDLFLTRLPFADTTLQTCALTLSPYLIRSDFEKVKTFVKSLFDAVEGNEKIDDKMKSRYKLGKMEISHTTGMPTIHFAHPDPLILQNILVVWISHRIKDHGLLTIELTVKTLTRANLVDAADMKIYIDDTDDSKK
jgi:hypothetical protein